MFTANRRLSQFYHVLHRLLVPRHPPNALTSLTTRKLVPSQTPRLTSELLRPVATFVARRQTVKSRSSFAFEHAGGGLILTASNIPDASVARVQLSRAARTTSWVSCELARPSECVASRAHNPSGRYALGFVLHASFNYGVFMTEPVPVGSSGPGKT